MSKKRSLVDKGAMNILSTVFGMVIPLFLYPYLLRVLGAEAYGRVAFAQSLTTWFTILATLGINNYAQRELAVLRDDRDAFNRKASEILVINTVLTSVAMTTYAAVLFAVPDLRTDFGFYMIYSVIILASGMKLEWMYHATESFDITSIRNVVSKLLYVIFSFALVRTVADDVVYSVVYVVTCMAIPMIANYVGLFVKKDNIRFRFSRELHIGECIKPIFFLSLLTIGSKLFSGLDVIMIRFLMDETSVGLYSAATKLPLVLDELLMAGAAVVTPRLFAAVQRKDENGIKRIVGMTSNALLFVAVPAILTFLFFSHELLYLFAGAEYATADTSLMIYSGIMFTTTVITLAGTRMYVARKKEMKLFLILLVAALLNFGLNYLLIGALGVTGATLATMIANLVLMTVELTLEKTWKYIFMRDKLKYCIAGGAVALVFALFRFLVPISSPFLLVALAICIAGIVYVSLLAVMRESTLLVVWGKVKRILKRT